VFVDVTGKNGQDRGWVLRSADEIKLELEDNTLNLQSMAGSKFVVIFSDQVTSSATYRAPPQSCLSAPSSAANLV
jgi:hypothetical protein